MSSQHEGPFYAQQPVVNAYQYNGKELNEEFGLGWLDYGARWYDAAIGRFLSVDPLAEIALQLAPYHYVRNNPITRVDPLGLTDYEINQKGKITKVEGTETEDGPDRLIKGIAKYRKKDGKLRNRNFIEVDQGSFENLESDDDMQIFSTKSGENADRVFDFITDGASVEFDKISIETGTGDKETHIFTSYDFGTVAGGTDYVLNLKDRDTGLQLIDITHNHPIDNTLDNRQTTHNPSFSDKDKAARLTQGPEFRNQKILPTFHIRFNGKDYEYKQLRPSGK